MKFKTEDLRIAAVRHFDIEHNGLEYTEPLGLKVLLQRGDTYINVLNIGEIAPIYMRVPYTTNKCCVQSELGVDDYFGTKVDLVSGEVQEGEAWLLTDRSVAFEMGKKEVTLRDVEDYVLRSSEYYPDRASIIHDRLQNGRLSFGERKTLIRTMNKDWESNNKVSEFFAERGIQKVIQK